MTTVVVAGFATIDYVVRVEGDFTGRGTRLMRQGADEAWPRAGGAALYASRRLGVRWRARRALDLDR